MATNETTRNAMRFMDGSPVSECGREERTASTGRRQLKVSQLSTFAPTGESLGSANRLWAVLRISWILKPAKAAEHLMFYRWHMIRAALIVIALSSVLAACADQKPDAHTYYFSDLPGNGHSRTYTYPTDTTRGYTVYPGFRDLGPIYSP